MDETVRFNNYIRCRADGAVLAGWSDGDWAGYRSPGHEDILITSEGGYHFRLGGVDNPPLFTEDGVPLYRWDGQSVRERSPEDIQAERDELPEPEPSAEEDRDVMMIDHEMRLTMLELGLN